MPVRDLLFGAADLWILTTGMDHHGRIGIEFLLYGLLEAGQDSPMYRVAFVLDAFSRSVGFTLILVLGLLVLTHGYRPSTRVEVGVFALAAVLGFVLSEFAEQIGTPGKVFFLLTALATSAFLGYFAWRLWLIAERAHAVWVGIATALNVVVASIYDFWPIPGDDADHTLFYSLALFVWGLAMLAIYRAYAAVDTATQALREAVRPRRLPADH
ncbi:transporter [Mycobacterium sp. PS03-16]|nr:transporter [Mycobacterium sp. PS03-16]